VLFSVISAKSRSWLTGLPRDESGLQIRWRPDAHSVRIFARTSWTSAPISCQDHETEGAKMSRVDRSGTMAGSGW